VKHKSLKNVAMLSTPPFFKFFKKLKETYYFTYLFAALSSTRHDVVELLGIWYGKCSWY